MERQKLSSAKERKRKRDSAREKLTLLEKKLQQQEEWSEQLNVTMQGIFTRLSVIQDLLVGTSPLEHSSWIRPISEHCPPSQQAVHKFKAVEDESYNKIDKGNGVLEMGSPMKWKSGTQEVIDIYRSQMQRPSTYTPWSRGEMHTHLGSSIHPATTNNAVPTFLSRGSSVDSNPFNFGSISGAGASGGRGVSINRNVTVAPLNTTQPETVGGQGGGRAEGAKIGNGVTERDSPCDCTKTRQFCKCRKHGGASTTAASTSTWRPQSSFPGGQSEGLSISVSPPPLTGSPHESPLMPKNTGEIQLTDQEKAMCICKGSGKVWRVCPLKAKRKQQRQISSGKVNDYAPADAQHFKEKDLDTVFDSKSELEVQIDPNEQLFMDVFPELNQDLSHHKEWPMPFTHMQDYSGIPKERFAEPLEFTDEELQNAFEEEKIPDTQLQDTECVFMDQFPELAEATTISRGHGVGQDPMSGLVVNKTPVESAATVHGGASVGAAGDADGGLSTQKKCPYLASNRSDQKSPMQPSAPSVPLTPGFSLDPPVVVAVDSRTLPGTAESGKGLMTHLTPSAPSQSSRKTCGTEPFDQCCCAPCKTTNTSRGAGGLNIPGDISAPKSPKNHLSPKQGSESSRLQQKRVQNTGSGGTVGDNISLCSCNPCPSRDGDRGGNLPTTALPPVPMQLSSTISGQTPIKQSSPMIRLHSVGTQASYEICPQQPLEGCQCKPTCSEHKVILRTFTTAKSAGKGMESFAKAYPEDSTETSPGVNGVLRNLDVPGKKGNDAMLYDPTRVTQGSSTQLGKTTHAFGDPQEWSDKELEHAFSEEDVANVELSPDEALFMKEFPELANIETFIRTPQPLPYTPQQDFPNMPKQCFAYPEEFSEKELDTAFKEEVVPDVKLTNDERNFMREFPGLSSFGELQPAEGAEGGGQSGVAPGPISRIGSGKPCRCHKRVVRPCKCKTKGKVDNAAKKYS